MQEPDASVVDEVHQPASPVPAYEVRQAVPDDMLQPVALPPPIGWDEKPDLVDVEVDQQADVSDTELEDTDDLAVVPPPPPLPDDTFPEDAGIPDRRELRRSERTRGPPDRYTAGNCVLQTEKSTRTVVRSDWLKRASFLLLLVEQHGLVEMSSFIAEAFMKIYTGL